MMPPFGYFEHPPGPLLADFVECLWTSAAPASDAPVTHRVLPDGCMDLLFDFDGDPGARVIGTMTRPLLHAASGAVDMLGIRFRAGGLVRLLGIDAGAFTDVAEGLDAVIGTAAAEWWERLADAAPAARIELARQLLAARLGQAAPADAYVAHCVARIERSNGGVRVAALEASTGIGRRQLERKFARHVGVSPKVFARVVRFRALTGTALAAPAGPNWAALAADFGYADQPHLVREFGALAGVTPSEYLASR